MKIKLSRDKLGGYFYFDETDKLGLSITHQYRYGIMGMVDGQREKRWFISAWLLEDGSWTRTYPGSVGNPDGYERLRDVREHIAAVERDRAAGYEVHWVHPGDGATYTLKLSGEFRKNGPDPFALPAPPNHYENERVLADERAAFERRSRKDGP